MNQESTQSKSIIITIGYITSFAPLLLLPIIFMPIAIIIGLSCILNNKIIDGLLIILLAIICGIIGAAIGGWGLGLSKFHLQ
jgi:hypothetical protein